MDVLPKSETDISSNSSTSIQTTPWKTGTQDSPKHSSSQNLVFMACTRAQLARMLQHIKASGIPASVYVIGILLCICNPCDWTKLSMFTQQWFCESPNKERKHQSWITCWNNCGNSFCLQFSCNLADSYQHPEKEKLSFSYCPPVTPALWCGHHSTSCPFHKH